MVSPYSVAPEVKPCVRFAKAVSLSDKPFCDVSRNAKEAVAFGGVDGAGGTGIAATFHDPVVDGIGELLRLCVERAGDEAHLHKPLHDVEHLLAILDAEYAFQSYDAADPRASVDIVCVATVPGFAWTERCTGSKPEE